MSKTVVKIGSFEVDDAHLHAGADRAGTLSIPCKSDPDLCMQLDGWDEHTSIPAILDGKQSLLYKQHYDRQADAWGMRLALKCIRTADGALFSSETARFFMRWRCRGRQRKGRSG